MTKADSARPPGDGAAASRRVRQSQLLQPPQIDDLANTLLLLARELWVVKDRQRVLEALLADNNIIATGAVPDHQPGPTLTAELATERGRFIASLMEALCPSSDDGA